jgi:hypothetical protein
MSANYLHPSDVKVEGGERLALYQFGDKAMNHFFCRTCGISPFSTVASVPPDYRGPARPGDYRINLGCVHDLDVLSLNIQIIDGKAL